MNRKLLIVGLVGLVLYAFLCAVVVLRCTPSPIPETVFNVLYVVSLLLNLWFFERASFGQDVYNVEQLFNRLTFFGLVSLGVVVLPDVVNYFLFPVYFYPELSLVFDFCSFYLVLLFLLLCLSYIKKLVLVKASRKVLKQWRFFILLLAVSTSFYLFNLAYYEWLLIIYGVLFILIAARLAIKIKWVALINRKTKWLSIIYLLVLTLIFTALFQKVFHLYLPHFIVEPLFKNLFFISISVFIIAYWLMAFLTNIFSLPLASVIENQGKELKSFQTLSRSIHRKDSINKTFKLLFRTCYNSTNSRAGWLLINKFENDENNQTFHTSAIKEEEILKLVRSTGLDEVFDKRSKEYYYNANLLKSGHLKELPKLSAFRSLLAFPIFVKGELWGGVYLLKDLVAGFDEYMVRLCGSYVEQAKIAFENASLVDELVENARLQEEMEVARTMQKKLIPQSFPENKYFETAAFTSTAREVGGDYYDYILKDEHLFNCVIGDVSGSGTSAAFYMAELKGIFHSLMLTERSPFDFVNQANAAVASCLSKEVFITLINAQFDFEKQLCFYCRAGHTPLLHYSASSGEARFLEDKGLGLGIVRDAGYRNFNEQNVQSFEPGDVFVLYTDGIIESRNVYKKEEFGFDRLSQAISEHAHLNAPGILKAVQDSIVEFKTDFSHSDDSSLLILKVKA